ncbi:MAG: hypothetical protein AAF494_00665 [Pseudomonadota bacterium]
MTLSLRQIGGLFALFFLVGVSLFQTVRIHGAQLDLPLVGAIGPEGLLAENMRLKSEANNANSARDYARFLASLQKARAERSYRQATKETDNAIETSLRNELARVRSFVAAGGLPNNQIRAEPALAATGDHDTRIDARSSELPKLDGLFDPPIVRVFAADVELCTINTVKAREWRQWGMKLQRLSSRDSLPK